jgi:hypothetical protein
VFVVDLVSDVSENLSLPPSLGFYVTTALFERYTRIYTRISTPDGRDGDSF